MSPKSKKRKYTFRKGQIVPYESRSLIHTAVKAEKEATKRMTRALGTPKKQKRKRKRN